MFKLHPISCEMFTCPTNHTQALLLPDPVCWIFGPTGSLLLAVDVSVLPMAPVRPHPTSGLRHLAGTGTGSSACWLACELTPGEQPQPREPVWAGKQPSSSHPRGTAWRPILRHLPDAPRVSAPERTTLQWLPPLPCLTSSLPSQCFWDPLPNKFLTFKSLSQGLLLGAFPLRP